LRGVLSTRIDSVPAALDHPAGYLPNGGEAQYVVDAAHLLPDMPTDVLLAGKMFDLDEHVLGPLTPAGRDPGNPTSSQSPRTAALRPTY
jgi:hypothetical protein